MMRNGGRPCCAVKNGEEERLTEFITLNPANDRAGPNCEESLESSAKPRALKHKITKEFLWIDRSWILGQLGKREMLIPSPETSYGKEEVFIGKNQSSKELKALSLSLVASLKACAKSKDLCQGSRLHAGIRARGLLENNAYVGNTLVSMYAKCGDLAKAQQVLDEMPVRDAVSWNALIAGYVQQGQGDEALDCFQHMCSEGLLPDAITYACILKACGLTRNADMGKQIHDDTESFGLLEKNVVLGNAVVNMYAKCGLLTKAQNVLDELPLRDVVTWSTLIAGYVQHGQGEEALGCFRQMQSNGFSPNAITYSCILKACGITRDVKRGEIFHDEIVSQRLLEKNVVLGNALVDMYVKCGVLTKAQEVLNELPIRDGVSWSFLITGYTQQGLNQEALGCFQQMRSEGLFPDASTYACILKACGNMREAYKGKKIHDEIASQGLLRKNVMLGSALVDMYVKCGVLTEAQKTLNELPIQDVVSWSALVAGYVQEGQGKKALECVYKMQSEGLSPNAITYACFLKACGITREVARGKEIHEEIVKLRLMENDVLLGNALVDMYVKFGELTKAQKVLVELPVRDVVSWSTLIGGYVQQGQGTEALDCLERMRSDGVSPDGVTYACILKACGITQEADRGKKFHDELVDQGLLEKHVVLGNALVDMYAKCGVLTKSQKVLDELHIRDVVSWSSLIAGYVEQRQGEEALGCFRQMQREGLSPNAITYACILKACGITQEIDKGMKIHEEIVKQRLLEQNVVLGNALLDMYAKCGVLAKAQNVFDELPIRDVVSWNALIAGYAQEGQGEEALRCFQQMKIEGLCPNLFSWNALLGAYAQEGLAEKAFNIFQWMQDEGTSPDAISFVCVLNACSHSGLVDEGQLYFANVMKSYGITPNKEHHTCMVDLFGRARHFDKAMKIIDQMPSSEYPLVWSALLGACQKWGNVKLGRLAFDHAVQLDGHDSAAYVLMANIYAAAGMQEEAQRIERMRTENAVAKDMVG